MLLQILSEWRVNVASFTSLLLAKHGCGRTILEVKPCGIPKAGIEILSCITLLKFQVSNM